MKYETIKRQADARCAKAQLEATSQLTMRRDAVSAKKIAIGEIDEYLEDGDEERLRNAKQVLREHTGGAVGDARLFFERAINRIQEP